MNLPESLIQMGSKRNIMREIREYGLLRAREVGAEKVLDFSLGNPSVEPPRRVNDFIRELLSGPEAASVHGYTTAQGELGVREKLAASLTRRFGGPYDAGALYLTVGAAAALCCCFRAWACPGDQFILLAPFFTEYTYFITGNGGEPVVVPPDYATFQPDLGALERRMEEALSRIEGAGEVSVVLTLRSGTRQVLAQDVSSARSQEDQEEDRTTVVVSAGSGREEAVALQQIYPQFQGALVVCAGGDDPAVQLKLVEAVSALTGLGSDKISICKGR